MIKFITVKSYDGEDCAKKRVKRQRPQAESRCGATAQCTAPEPAANSLNQHKPSRVRTLQRRSKLNVKVEPCTAPLIPSQVSAALFLFMQIFSHREVVQNGRKDLYL